MTIEETNHGRKGQALPLLFERGSCTFILHQALQIMELALLGLQQDWTK